MLNCRCCKKYIVIKLYSRNNCGLGPSICLALSALPYPAHLFNYILTHLLARPPDYKPACLPAYQPTNTPNPSTSTLTQTHLPPNFQPVWSESLLCASYLSTYLTTDPSAHPPACYLSIHTNQTNLPPWFIRGSLSHMRKKYPTKYCLLIYILKPNSCTDRYFTRILVYCRSLVALKRVFFLYFGLVVSFDCGAAAPCINRV